MVFMQLMAIKVVWDLAAGMQCGTAEPIAGADLRFEIFNYRSMTSASEAFHFQNSGFGIS